MMSLFLRRFACVTLVLLPMLAGAADPTPDVRGKWTGKTYAIVAGSGGHHPGSKGTWEKPLLSEKDVVFEIVGQDGRRFWGITTLAGTGEKTTEPFIGILGGKDSRTLFIADTDGYFDGQLMGSDTIAFTYRHAGGKSPSSVVGISEVKRSR